MDLIALRQSLRHVGLYLLVLMAGANAYAATVAPLDTAIVNVGTGIACTAGAAVLLVARYRDHRSARQVEAHLAEVETRIADARRGRADADAVRFAKNY